MGHEDMQKSPYWFWFNHADYNLMIKQEYWKENKNKENTRDFEVRKNKQIDLV